MLLIAFRRKGVPSTAGLAQPPVHCRWCRWCVRAQHAATSRARDPLVQAQQQRCARLAPRATSPVRTSLMCRQAKTQHCVYAGGRRTRSLGIAALAAHTPHAGAAVEVWHTPVPHRAVAHCRKAGGRSRHTTRRQSFNHIVSVSALRRLSIAVARQPRLTLHTGTSHSLVALGRLAPSAHAT
jgi:hypothetical protein